MWPLDLFKVSGHSMEPDYEEGVYVLINRLAYLAARPKIGDVIALRHPTDEEKILLKVIDRELPDKNYAVKGFNKADSLNLGSVGRNVILGKAVAKI
jgi:signal peptidase I